jgi:hypothetical protein
MNHWYDAPSQPFGTILTRVEISQSGSITYEWTVAWWGLPFYWGSFLVKSISERMRVTVIANLKELASQQRKDEEKKAGRSSRITSSELSNYRKVH